MEFRAVTVISRADTSDSPIDTTSSSFRLNCPGSRSNQGMAEDYWNSQGVDYRNEQTRICGPIGTRSLTRHRYTHEKSILKYFKIMRHFCIVCALYLGMDWARLLGRTIEKT